jgi:hypothetical protein
MQALAQAEYARLRTSIELGGTLVHLREPHQQRPVLEQIVENGSTTLERARGAADPYLLSSTHMTRAAAQYDLANIATGPEARAAKVAEGTGECFAALKIALGSGSTLVTTTMLPWALVVLTGGLRAAKGAQSDVVQAMMIGCAQAIPREHDRQKRARIEGARTLFQAQLLLRSALQLSDARERGVVLGRAAEACRDARRALLGAGDFTVAAQAKATLGEIERSRSSGGGKRAGYPKFCPSCGTQTTDARFCANCGAKLGLDA